MSENHAVKVASKKFLFSFLSQHMCCYSLLSLLPMLKFSNYHPHRLLQQPVAKVWTWVAKGWTNHILGPEVWKMCLQTFATVFPDFRDQILVCPDYCDPRRDSCSDFPDSNSSLWSGKSRRFRLGLESGTVSGLVAKTPPFPPWPGKSSRLHLDQVNCAVSALAWKNAAYPPRSRRFGNCNTNFKRNKAKNQKLHQPSDKCLSDILEVIY